MAMHSKGRVVLYKVPLVKHVVHITVLHVNHNAPERQNQQILGSGGFGHVLLRSVGTRQFVVKQQRFSVPPLANREDI
jgi:hypothetical protein